MRTRLGAGLAAACALAAPAAQAAPTDLTLRVEGRATTLYEGPLRTTTAPVDGGDGTGVHDCGAGASPASALLASGQSWAGTWNPDFLDFFLDRVGADASDPQSTAYWSILVDWRYVSGLCRAPVAPGGEVLLALGPGARILRLAGPARVAAGEPFTVSVRDGWIRADSGADGGPVDGATVGGVATGADGRATLRFDTSGLRRLKAAAPNAIRSNALDVCVGDERCAGALPPPPAPPAPPAPALSVDVPAAGERYARGGATLELRGRGPGDVAVALTGRRNDRCTGLAAAGRMSVMPCTRAPDAVPATARAGAWSMALRERLAPGRYRLAVTSAGSTVTRRFAVAAAPRDVRAATAAAVRWLRRAQARDGGFGAAPGSRPSTLFTDWAAIALARAAPGSRTLRRALRRVRATHRGDLAALQRGAIALARSRADRRRVRRLQAAIARRQRDDGSWRGELSATAYAVVALRGSGRHGAVRRGRAWLRAQPLPADADTLGALLWAAGDTAPPAAVTRLRTVQGADGGFATRAGAPSNAQSTALAVIGLEAAGVPAGSIRSDTGISGPDYLRARQSPSGRVAYTRDAIRTPTWVTAQALLALAAT